MMTANYQRGSPVTQTGNINNYMENGVWVKKESSDRITGPQTQLLFNLAFPTNVLNRATRVGRPGPIVIEKLVAHQRKQAADESCRSSLRLSVLSEDQLQAAVRLAQKDLRRKREETVRLSHQISSRSPSPDKDKSHSHQNVVSSKCTQKKGSPKRQTMSCKHVLVYTPQKLGPPSKTENAQSPPTRDPGLKAISNEQQLSRDIHKLQKVLETYIQSIEQLVNKGRILESLEPDEKRRIEIRQQEQAARSARIIYVLQRQVKDIQEDLEKLRTQSGRPTNKCRVVNRLAAAHRGAVRAMQAFIQHLSDPAESRVPVQCKALGQLIRQLSLCSARLEVGPGSAVAETALDILQKLEKLDLALSKQDRQEQESHRHSVSPVTDRIFRVNGHSTSLSRFPQAQAAKATRQPKNSTPTKNRRPAGQPLKVRQSLDQERKHVLKAGIQKLMHMREMSERESRVKLEKDIPVSSSTGAQHDKNKPNLYIHETGFQQPTVSSKLKESQLPPKETVVPWIPTSPHSPVKQRAVSSRPEPRCLFSPVMNSLQTSLGVQAKSQCQGKTNTENIRENKNKTLRQDTVTENKPSHLSQEEMEDVGRHRAKADTDGVEQAARERPQPLLEKDYYLTDFVQLYQTAVMSDVEATAGTAESLDGEHDAMLQDPVLDNMLLRVEEIEKDEQEVRRRFAMISYTDPLLWDMDTGTQRKHNSSRPASPQPIRLTKPALKPSTTGDIVLQKPVETGAGSEISILDEDPTDAVPSCPSTEQAHGKGGVQLKVPSSLQKNIQRYREEYDSYLRLVSNAAVGSFNACAVAESLAEELIMEALTDVAGEVQDVCEEYAEAIFTSEFLTPIKSPSTSVS